MAIRAAQTMTLVLGDKRLDLRQFPNLMSQWSGIVTPQTSATLATRSRFKRHHFLALVGGNQRPLVLGVPRLTTRPVLRLGLGRSRFGVGMLGTGRQRRILRGLVQTRCQFRDPSEQLLDKRSHYWRHLGFNFGGNRPGDGISHAPSVVEIGRCAKTSFCKRTAPGCESLRLERTWPRSQSAGPCRF